MVNDQQSSIGEIERKDRIDRESNADRRRDKGVVTFYLAGNLLRKKISKWLSLNHRLSL